MGSRETETSRGIANRGVPNTEAYSSPGAVTANKADAERLAFARRTAIAAAKRRAAQSAPQGYRVKEVDAELGASSMHLPEDAQLALVSIVYEQKETKAFRRELPTSFYTTVAGLKNSQVRLPVMPKADQDRHVREKVLAATRRKARAQKDGEWTKEDEKKLNAWSQERARRTEKSVRQISPKSSDAEFGEAIFKLAQDQADPATEDRKSHELMDHLRREFKKKVDVAAENVTRRNTPGTRAHYAELLEQYQRMGDTEPAKIPNPPPPDKLPKLDDSEDFKRGSGNQRIRLPVGGRKGVERTGSRATGTAARATSNRGKSSG